MKIIKHETLGYKEMVYNTIINLQLYWPEFGCAMACKEKKKEREKVKIMQNE